MRKGKSTRKIIKCDAKDCGNEILSEKYNNLKYFSNTCCFINCNKNEYHVHNLCNYCFYHVFFQRTVFDKNKYSDKCI